MIELFGMASPNVQKVGIMLEELGVEYQLHHVAVMGSEQFSPEFRRLNPLSKVPVLVDHDRGESKPVFESGAILFYLAETYKALLPDESMGRYDVMAWLMVQMANIGPMFGQLNHFQIVGDQIDAYPKARYLSQSKRLYALLDERLSDHQWIAADNYSIADIAIYPWSNYLERHGFKPQDYPCLMAWRNRMAEREAVRRMMARFDKAFSKQSTETILSATSEDLDRFFGRDPENPPADFSVLTRMVKGE